jgi:hypothetical protein
MDHGQAGMSGQNDRDSASQARDPRDSLLLMARLRIGDETEMREVRVRNLSAGGLMAEIDRPLAPDTAVTVELRGIGAVTGRVAWFAEGRAGIALDREVDPARARKPVTVRARPVAAPAPRRRPV